jgi:hypothetical protein
MRVWSLIEATEDPRPARTQDVVSPGSSTEHRVFNRYVELEGERRQELFCCPQGFQPTRCFVLRANDKHRPIPLRPEAVVDRRLRGVPSEDSLSKANRDGVIRHLEASCGTAFPPKGERGTERNRKSHRRQCAALVGDA